MPSPPPETTPEPTITPSPSPEPSPPPTSEVVTEDFEVEINMSESEIIEVPQEKAPDTAPAEGNSGEAPPVAGSADSGGGTVTIDEPSEEAAGETNLESEGYGAIGTIVDSYTELLKSGLGALYECEKGYVYFENITDFLTVNRSSPEHMLITEAGGYNVAEKLKSNALNVDSGWVLRKNPTVIVKCVSSDILGKNVTDSTRAAGVAAGILSRDGFAGISSVINRDVVLISEELLATADGRLLAKLYMARAMYPPLFAGEDVIGEFCAQIRYAGGADYTVGMYTY